MNRRKLFPLFAAVPVALLLPEMPLSASRAPADARKEIGDLYRPEYGEAVEWNHREYNMGYATRKDWLADVEKHVEYLHARAKACLKRGSQYEIRSKIPTNYGINLGIAWYSNPSINTYPLCKAEAYPGTHNRLGGYGFMGVFRV